MKTYLFTAALSIFLFVHQNSDLVTIELQQTFYNAQEEIDIEYHFGGPDSVYLPHCDFQIGSLVEKKENGNWQDYSSELCDAIYLSGLMLANPDSTYFDKIKIRDVGEYRIRFAYYLDSEFLNPQSATSSSLFIR
jgi:hypothetical protein